MLDGKDDRPELLLRGKVAPTASPSPVDVARLQTRTPLLDPPCPASSAPTRRRRRSRILSPVGHWPATWQVGSQNRRSQGCLRGESSNTTAALSGMTLASAIDSSIMRLLGVGGATFPDLNDFDITQPQLTASLRRALAIALTKLGLRAVFQAADGGNDNTHRTV